MTDLQSINVHLAEDTDGIHCRLMYLEPIMKYTALAAFSLNRLPFWFQIYVDPPELARLTELAEHDWFREKVQMVLGFRVDQAITSGALRLPESGALEPINRDEAFDAAFALLEQYDMAVQSSNRTLILTEKGQQIIHILLENAELQAYYNKMLATGLTERIARLALLIATAREAAFASPHPTGAAGNDNG